jgi:hypothetical protein
MQSSLKVSSVSTYMKNCFDISQQILPLKWTHLVPWLRMILKHLLHNYSFKQNIFIYLQFIYRCYQFCRLYSWKRRGKKQSWPNLRYYPCNSLKVQKKTMKNLSQDSQCLSQDLKQAPSKHKSKTLPLEPMSSVIFLLLTILILWCNQEIPPFISRPNLDTNGLYLSTLFFSNYSYQTKHTVTCTL